MIHQEIEFIQEVLLCEYKISSYELLDHLICSNTYTDYLHRLEDLLRFYDYTGGI